MAGGSALRPARGESVGACGSPTMAPIAALLCSRPELPALLYKTALLKDENNWSSVCRVRALRLSVPSRVKTKTPLTRQPNKFQKRQKPCLLYGSPQYLVNSLFLPATECLFIAATEIVTSSVKFSTV